MSSSSSSSSSAEEKQQQQASGANATGSGSGAAAAQPVANVEKTSALVARDFDKLRQAPPSTTKEAFGADNFKRVQKISDENDFKFWKSQPQPSFGKHFFLLLKHRDFFIK